MCRGAVFCAPTSHFSLHTSHLKGGGMSEEEKKDFVVRDRRAFSDENQDEQDKKDTAEENSADRSQDKDTPDDEDAKSQAFKAAASEGQAGASLPEINFATFIFSLHSSVLMQLGLVSDPGTGQQTKNLPAAKQTIDILGLLEEKTRGNLAEEEENMLKSILYDLRMIYVREIS